MNQPERIMVVDDEKRICENVKKILAKNQYEVDFAESADEALGKLAEKSYSLLISDIVMPGKNGLELLKLVKSQWPLTKAIMMTAYASTDTAMKAIRLGALDYVPKPFTPEELRRTVHGALKGELQEAATSPEEREFIDAIDLDIPFDREEVSDAAGEEYADMLGRSDMPVVEVKARAPLEGFCDVGVMVCDIFKKLGATCKAGTKSGECPRKKAGATKKGAQKSKPAVKTLVGIDQPFNYQEVVAVTGPEYVEHLHHDGVSFLPYEELKARISSLKTGPSERIDVDMPFSREEVAEATGENYADTLGRSDMPVVEVTASADLENFCEVGSMVCDIFKKLGATCKAGTKSGACPQKKAKKAKGAPAPKRPAVEQWVGIDQPFEYEEVAAAVGREYANLLQREDVVMVPYEELKKRVAAMQKEAVKPAAAQRMVSEGAARSAVLVIDDEVAVNNNIRKILSKRGYSVEQAVTKAEALESIRTRAYQLVLLDLKIPGVNGLELLEAIRREQPEARVIIVTGYASIETAVESARKGAVGYVPKPFTPEELRKAAGEAYPLAA